MAIEVVVSRPGTFTNTATVSSNTDLVEASTANNRASRSVTGTAKRSPVDPEPAPGLCRDKSAPGTGLLQRDVRVSHGKARLSACSLTPTTH